MKRIKSVKRILLIFLILFTLNTLTFAVNTFIRNSSEEEMSVQLLRKSDKTVIYQSNVPSGRTVLIKNLKKAVYYIYYKKKGRQQWRVMMIRLLQNNKTFILF